MENDLISRKTMKEMGATCFARRNENGKLEAIISLDNAPTVEPFEPDYIGAERLKARQRGYEEGYHNGMKIGKTLNPKIKQGEWITKEHSIEYYCSNCGERLDQCCENFCCHCGAEMKGGAE